MSSLPEEIYFEIFLKIPAVKSLLSCRCVCKTWCSLISRPDFVKMHHNLTIERKNPNLMLRGFDNRKPPGKRNVIYTIGLDLLLLSPGNEFLDHAVEIDDYPFKSSLGYSVQLMACCDGLACLWFGNRSRFCLWNPATREYKVLPKSSIEKVDMVAFGYDYKSNDYKLLAGYHSLFEVCSLGSNSWKTIENVPYEFTDKVSFGLLDDKDHPSGVLVNGNLHWLAEMQHSFNVVLVSLDISNEIFKEVGLPFKPLTMEDAYRDFRNLGVLEGRLCLFVVNFRDGAEIWKMENYGVPESWTKRYIVKNKTINDVFLRLMWPFNSGEILFGSPSAGLYLYFPGDDKFIEINISSLTKLYEQECYFESLVSLKSGTYVVGEEQMEESDTPAYIQWE